MMKIPRPMKRAGAAALSAVAALFCLPLHAFQADFASAVVATHPLAYYRLDSTAGKSLVGTTTYKAVGGVSIVMQGAPTGGNNRYTKLDGVSGNIVTTQAGGVSTAASIMAWVKLVELPSKTGRLLYIAGESQNGNDLDVQFDSDDAIKFWTAAGGHITYTPPSATLVNQWHLVIVTVDTQSQTRVIYWDGKAVATDRGGGEAGKTSLFTMGSSTVFGGRFFKGGIAEAALWSRALKAAEVATIYSAAKPGGSAPQASGGSSMGMVPTTGPFASKAKIEIEDANGPVQLRREEQIAYMFLSAIEIIEHNCQLTLQQVCPLDQILTGSYPQGSSIEHLKFDPNKTDPNYTYTLAASGMAWEAHANPKRPGLKGFCSMARNIGTTTVTYNPSGVSGWTDTELGNRGMEGDSFAVQ